MTKLEKVIKGLELLKQRLILQADVLGYGEHISDIDNALELLKAKDTNVPTKWVSVKDRLPSEEDYKECKPFPDGAVLWYDGTSVGVGWYYESTNKWSDIDDHEVVGVTLWKPIFEPPKEGDEE